jgi:tetratricopeptide (TPR) repeat protein
VAVQWYQAALARNPYDYLTYLWLASLHGQLDQAEDARMALEGALRAGPRIPYLLTTLAFQYRQTGRLAEAQELLQEAARLDDTNGTTWLSLLNVAEINHDWAVAAHALRRVLELSGGNEDLHRLLASYQLQAGDYASAEQTLARLRQTNPNDEALFKDTIRLLVDTGRWDEAETQLTGFLRQNPDAAWAHAALGRIYYQTKRFDRATASLEKAHDLDPGDEQVERLLNKTYELAGDKQRSFNYYERRLLSARRFTSDELDRYLSLARDLNEMPRAAETLRRLSDGNLPAAQRTAVAVARGRLLEQDGRTAEAIAVYRGLLTRRSRPAQVLHELGRLHFQLGEAAAGEAYFRELAYSTGDARLLMSAARLSAQRSARSLAADLYGAAYRADPRQTSAGVLYLESLLLADEDRGNAQLVWDLDQVVRQDDERELLFWLELFWAADQGRADYFDPLLPHALRFIAKRPETKVELVAWPTVVQARFFGDEQTRLLDLLRVFTRQMSAADFARRYHVPLGQP